MELRSRWRGTRTAARRRCSMPDRLKPVRGQLARRNGGEKEGKLKGHKEVVIQDLPGIYSLSPYTLEEVVARSYLVGEKPDAILNIVDGTNIERNLYLTTQLIELGIPVVVAVNMIDLVRKSGDTIDLGRLGRPWGARW